MGCIHRLLFAKSRQVIGDAHREIEAPIKSTLANWAGEDVAELFRRAGAFFQSVGGYPLPTPRG